MKKQTYFIITLFISIFVLTNFAFAQKDKVAEDKNAQDIAKVEKFIEDSKIPHIKVEKDIWTLVYEGKNKKELDIVIALGDGLIVYQGVVCKTSELDLNKDLYKKLVELSNTFDKGKFVFTDDGYLIFRIDSTVRIMDLQEFTENADQAASAINESWPDISKFLKK